MIIRMNPYLTQCWIPTESTPVSSCHMRQLKRQSHIPESELWVSVNIAVFIPKRMAPRTPVNRIKIQSGRHQNHQVSLRARIHRFNTLNGSSIGQPIPGTCNQVVTFGKRKCDIYLSCRRCGNSLHGCSIEKHPSNHSQIEWEVSPIQKTIFHVETCKENTAHWFWAPSQVSCRDSCSWGTSISGSIMTDNWKSREGFLTENRAVSALKVGYWRKYSKADVWLEYRLLAACRGIY